MSQATISPATTTQAPGASIAAIAPIASAPAPAHEELGLLAQLRRGIGGAPLLFLLVAGVGVGYIAIGFSNLNGNVGILLGTVPILLAAAFLLCGILSCVFFLEDENH